MVVSNELYSPQAYLELVTGNCYCISGDNDVVFIDKVLRQNGFTNLCDYPLSKIDYIVENNLRVVLVECLVWDDDFESVKELRWREVPEGITV